MKRNIMWMMVGTLFLAPLSAYANSMEGQCAARNGYGMMAHHREGQCPIAGGVLKKARFLLEHRSDLGLTDAQVKTIEDLKLQVEKDVVRQKAEQRVFKLDLKSKLHQDKIDVEGTNAMIDQNFSSLSAAAKSNVEVYAKLKETLTVEQKAKIKEIWKNKKAEFAKNCAGHFGKMGA